MKGATTSGTDRLGPVAFILGTPRSGTTLLRVMLAGHPMLFSPPEMLLAPFETMAERAAHLKQRFWEVGGLRRALMALQGLDEDGAVATVRMLEDRTVPEVYAHLRALIGDRILIDKCPHLCGSPRALERVARWFPDARYLWLVRHPASVVRSIERLPMAGLIIRSYAGDLRNLWHRGNLRIQRHLESIPRDRWTMIRFEDLVRDPRPAMERACASLGVPFHDAVLDPYEGDRMRDGPPLARAVGDPGMAARGRIDASLALSGTDDFDARYLPSEAHDLARDLGYDLRLASRPPVTRVSDAMDAVWATVRDLEASLRGRDEVEVIDGQRFLLELVSRATEHIASDRADVPAASCVAALALTDVGALLEAGRSTAATGAARLANDLACARDAIRVVFRRTDETGRMLSMAARSRFVEVPGERLLEAPDVRFQVAAFRIDSGQRAVVRGHLPRARDFGIGLYDTWLQPLRSGSPVWLDQTRITTVADSTYEVRLSDGDREREDRLDTCGRECGFVIARATLPSGATLPEMTLERGEDHEGRGRSE